MNDNDIPFDEMMEPPADTISDEEDWNFHYSKGLELETALFQEINKITQQLMDHNLLKIQAISYDEKTRPEL